MPNKNVVLYTRVSTEEQAKGNSPQYQLSYLEGHCKRNNYEVIKVFEDDYSAKTFKRPKWAELTEFCKNNKKGVDLILFTRWDRFSRNIKEATSALIVIDPISAQ